MRATNNIRGAGRQVPRISGPRNHRGVEGRGRGCGAKLPFRSKFLQSGIEKSMTREPQLSCFWVIEPEKFSVIKQIGIGFAEESHLRLVPCGRVGKGGGAATTFHGTGGARQIDGR
jgi:hypothetical protein